MNVLIIGANGFIGKHLTNFFYNQKNNKIFTIDLKDSKDLVGENKFIGDIIEPNFIKKCIEESQPDLVYYLISFFSLNDIESFTSSIKKSLTCLKNLFDNLKSRQRLIFVGSSAQYGKVPSSLQPVNENAGFFPISSYGVFKIFEENEICRLANKYNIDFVGARIFNITGPGEPTRMVGGSIVSQLKNGSSIKMGNLSPKRDFVDVRDVVSALVVIGNQGKSKEIYNICSGKSISIRNYLELIVKELGIKPEISIDQNRVNPNDLKDLVGDNSKIIKELNWNLKYDLRKSIKDLVKNNY
jgi:GDP-4-dehydro-6-deoxy-D-mannose reductase